MGKNVQSSIILKAKRTWIVSQKERRETEGNGDMSISMKAFFTRE